MSDAGGLRRGPNRAIFGPGRHANYSIAARTEGWSDEEAERAAGVLQGLNFNISLVGGLAFIEDTSAWHLFFRYQTARKRDSVGRQYLSKEVTQLSRDEFLRIRCNPFRLQLSLLLEPTDPQLEPPGLPATTVEDDRGRLEHLLRSPSVSSSRLQEVVAALIEAERVVLAQALTIEELELLYLLLPVPLRGLLTFQSPIHEPPPESVRIPRLLVVPRGALDGYGGLIVDLETGRGAQPEARTIARELLKLANNSARWAAFLEAPGEVTAHAGTLGAAIAALVREARLQEAEERDDPVAFLDLVASTSSPSLAFVERFLRRFRPETAIDVLKAAVVEESRDRIQFLAAVLERVYTNPEGAREIALRDGLWSMRDRWTGPHPVSDRLMRPFLLIEALRRDAPSEAVQLVLGSLERIPLPGNPDPLPDRMKHLGRLLYANEAPQPDAILRALSVTPGWADDVYACRSVVEWTARLFLGSTANQTSEATTELLEPCEKVWSAISRSRSGVLTLTQDAGVVLSFLGVEFAPRAGWLQEPNNAIILVRDVASLLELDTGSGYARPRSAVVLAWLLLRRVRDHHVGKGAIGAAVALVRWVESRGFEISSLRERLLRDPGIATLLVLSGMPLHEAGPDFRHDVFVQALSLEMEKAWKTNGDGSELVAFCGRMAREGVYLRKSDFSKDAGSALPDPLAQMFSTFAREKDGIKKLRWIYLNLEFITEPAATDALRAGFAEAAGNAVGPVELWLLSRSLSDVNRARTLAAFDRVHGLHEKAIEERTDFTGADVEALKAFTRLPKRPPLRIPFLRRAGDR